MKYLPLWKSNMTLKKVSTARRIWTINQNLSADTGKNKVIRSGFIFTFTATKVFGYTCPIVILHLEMSSSDRQVNQTMGR